MRVEDLADVARISTLVHPLYPERDEVPAERLRLFRAGCLIASLDGAIVGYAIAHPGVVGQPPALDALLGTLPASADCLYIHDVALLSDSRSQRLGETAVEALLDVARRHGFPSVALTAVNNSAEFWARQGFSAVAAAKSLASYGEDAVYMVRHLYSV